MRSIAETQSAVQMLMCDYAATSQCASPLHRFNLQAQVLKADGVVAVDRAFELQREDASQVALGARHKGAAPFGGCDLKAAVELGDVLFPQETIGVFQGGASRQAQRLRRIGGNHADPQFTQRPAHLSETMRVDRFSGFRGQPEMAAAIAVEGAE